MSSPQPPVARCCWAAPPSRCGARTTPRPAGGAITTGDFDIAAGTTPQTYWDVSGDRTDESTTNPVTGLPAHAITSLASYRIVPGDTLQANYQYLVDITGDNLVIEAAASLGSGTAGPTSEVEYTARAYYTVDGTTWVAAGTAPVAITVGSPTPVTVGLFQAPETGQAAGSPDEVTGTPLPILDALEEIGGANLVVVITATIPETVDDQEGVGAVDTLGTLTVSITQTRDAGEGNFS